MRWIDPKQYHVTQYFIGEVKTEQLDFLSSTIAPALTSTNPFCLFTLGFEFKPARNPKLLWLRFEQNPAYTSLQQNLHNALVEAGFANEPPPPEPTPHVTLIRLKQIKPVEAALPPFPPFSLNVQEIELMQSYQKPTGSEYVVAERFKLSQTQP